MMFLEVVMPEVDQDKDTDTGEQTTTPPPRAYAVPVTVPGQTFTSDDLARIVKRLTTSPLEVETPPTPQPRR